MIEARQLSAKQGNRLVFKGLDLHLKQGEVVSLLGPNGCGKTTLLRTLLGLHPKQAGQVLWRGKQSHTVNAKEQARFVSYVPQYHRLAFGYTVIEMVLMGVMASHSEWVRASLKQRQKAQQALDTLNIGHLSQRPYTELSGGQRQLVLIARALAQETPYIFMDEPTNGLDYGNQIKLLSKIQNLAGQERGILLTTHHPEHALAVSNRVIAMQDGALTLDGEPNKIVSSINMQNLYGLTREQMKRFSVQLN